MLRPAPTPCSSAQLPRILPTLQTPLRAWKALPSHFHQQRLYQFSSSRNLSKFPFPDFLKRGPANFFHEGIDNKDFGLRRLSITQHPCPTALGPQKQQRPVSTCTRGRVAMKRFMRSGNRLHSAPRPQCAAPCTETLAQCPVIPHLTSSCCGGEHGVGAPEVPPSIWLCAVASKPFPLSGP